MAALKALAIAAALLVATPAAANPPRDAVGRWRAEIAEASARFGVPMAWLERVMRADSGGKILLGGRPITSRAGAMGLMQLMPATWSAMRAAHRLGANPHDPRDNVLAGSAYLRAMYDRFGYPGLFAAYNAGPGRYAAYLATGRPLPAETRAYIAMVSGGAPRSSPGASDRPPPLLFAVLGHDSEDRPPPPVPAPPGSPDPLFAVRRSQ